MDRDTLISMMEMVRQRLLGSLEAIEKSGRDVGEVLRWRPGAGRAHIAWQAMHCAATHDRYLNVFIKGESPVDEKLVAAFGGGSVPSDQNVPGLGEIRQALEKNLRAFTDYVRTLKAEDLGRMVGPADRRRTLGDAIQIMVWHEAHHQGQIHLTWNLHQAGK
jgi:uncharacterized damage-inducible protein DinB